MVSYFNAGTQWATKKGNPSGIQPDAACEVNLVRDQSRPMRIRTALSNSLGFGGSNSSLVFRHPDEVPAT